MFKCTRLLLLALTTLGLLACNSTQPLLSVHQPVPATAPALQEQQLMQRTLVSALVRRKWQVEQTLPNQVLAKIELRGEQSASIAIDYDASGYDIRYRDSQNMDYADGQIHKRYNGLVKKLNRTIAQEMRFAQSISAIAQ